MLERAGVEAPEIVFTRIAEMRYLGQRKELAVRLPDGKLGADQAGAIRRAFEAEYERVYRRIHAGHAVEVRTLRLVAEGAPIVGSVAVPPAGAAELRAQLRTIRLEGSDAPCPARVYRRERVPAGARIQGPAIIEESYTAIVVGDGSVATCDGSGNLVVELGGGGHGGA